MIPSCANHLPKKFETPLRISQAHAADMEQRKSAGAWPGIVRGLSSDEE